MYYMEQVMKISTNMKQNISNVVFVQVYHGATYQSWIPRVAATFGPDQVEGL